MVNKLKNRLSEKKFLFLYAIYCLPAVSFAEDVDPLTRSGSKIMAILFGRLGFSICALVLGSTFILALIGKVSWDRFIVIGFLTAGFIGAPSIVQLIASWVQI